MFEYDIQIAIEAGELDEYTKCTIIDMTNRVVMHIARRHKQVREGVKQVMGGQVLEYEAKTILNRGRLEGIKLTKAVLRLDGEGYAVSDIATELSVSVDEVKRILED